MFIDLETMDDYESHLVASGLQIVHRQDLTRQCAKSWGSRFGDGPRQVLWALAAKMGKDFVTYLKSFHAMRAGYASGDFVYGLFTAWKPSEGAN